jgi:hypothetical protein
VAGLSNLFLFIYCKKICTLIFPNNILTLYVSKSPAYSPYATYDNVVPVLNELNAMP